MALTRAVLNLGSLRHNLSVVRTQAPDSRVMAVVKSNAYGHGLERVVQTLTAPALAALVTGQEPDAGAGDQAVDGFAVATLDEAQRVRRLSDRRVLLLEGVLTADELVLAQRLKLDLVVHSMFQLDLLRRAEPAAEPIRVWLKADTGMHRLGFNAKDAFDVWHTLKILPQVDDRIVLMSHLANADDVEDQKTVRQQSRFQSLVDRVQATQCSLANSAGLLGWPETRLDWVRPGLCLYGGSPLVGKSAAEIGLKPVLTLQSTLIAINQCRKGDWIGYGARYQCPQDMPVGVVAVGYGDGYPRHAVDGTPVLLNGRHCGLLGRVSMNLMTIDLRPAPQSLVGDRVTLWGDGLPVEEVARHADSISYELLCGTTSRVSAMVRD